MSAPDDLSLKFLLDYSWAAVGGLVTVVWKGLGGKIKEHDLELTRQRDTQAKIFDQLIEMRKESAEGREKVMEGQLELLKAFHAGLDRKADK